MPKSAILTRPLRSISTFAGLMSLCIYGHSPGASDAAEMIISSIHAVMLFPSPTERASWATPHGANQVCNKRVQVEERRVLTVCL